MLSDGPQSRFGTPEFDEKIRAAEALTGQQRQEAFAKLFADQPEEIVQMRLHRAHEGHPRQVAARRLHAQLRHR